MALSFKILTTQISNDHNRIAVDFVDQTMPRELCGYHLLANIFYRLGLNAPPPLDLSNGQHGPLIQRVRQEARRVWVRAEGQTLSFAANIRD